MYRVLVAMVLCVPASALLDAPEHEKSKTVPRLIERLGNSEFSEREGAAKELLERGPAVLPELRKALTHIDGEVARRADVLVTTLERIAALEPKRVSIRLNRRSIREAVAEIAKQTGYALQVQLDPTRDKLLYNFDFDKLTFWEAMARLIEIGDLALHPDEHHGLRLVHTDRHSPYSRQNGVVRMTAQSFQYQRGIDLAQMGRNGADAEARSESLAFSFSVSTEPKVPLLGLGEIKVTSAYDDQNRSMLPPAEPAQEPQEFFWGGAMRRFFFAQMDVETPTHGNSKTHTLMTQANLIRPSVDSKKLKSIKGTVLATFLVDQRPEIVIDDPLKAKGKKFTAGKVTLELGESEGNTNAGGTYRIKMNVIDDNAKNAHHHLHHWVNSMHEHFELIDGKGKKYWSQHAGCEHIDSNRAQVELHFAVRGQEKLGKPVKLVYHKWVTMQHPVEFEFNDLPLP